MFLLVFEYSIESWSEESLCEIRTKLRKNKLLNPFNSEYNKEAVHNVLEGIKKSGVRESNDANLILASTPFFNKVFNGFYTLLDKTVRELGVTYTDMQKYIIAIANRDFTIIKAECADYMAASDAVKFEEINHIRFNSSNPSMTEINASSGVEVTIDSAITLLNFLRNREERLNSITRNEDLDKIGDLYSCASYYVVIKNAYDVAVWENGSINLDKEKNIKFKYPNSLYPKLKNIGVTRIQENTLMFELQTRNLLQNNSLLQQGFLAKKLKKIKRRGIVELTIRNEEIEFSIKKQPISIAEFDIQNEAAMLVYYPFFEDVSLKNLGSMTLDDILVLFAQLQRLAEKIEEKTSKKVEVETIADLEKFAYRIRIDVLENYLNTTTRISKNQINHFLRLLESFDGTKRIDLWAKPLMKVGTYYFLPLIPIIAPNILFLIDVWLEEGGYNLENRGKLFERYIKNLVNKSMDGRFTYKIPNKNKFIVNESNFEEIDFVLLLKEVIVVAEVKCIKYPFGPRDFYNSMQRLTEGANQVIRKTQFLKENAEKFLDDLGEINNKEFISVVITNYPSFSGLKIEGVPVIDFFLLDGYINSGKLNQAKVEWKGENQISLSERTKKVYYSNEKEFNCNLKNYILNPAPVEEKLQKLVIVDKRISLEGVAPQIYIQEVIMKSDETNEN